MKENKKYGGLCINKYVHELTQLTIIRILAIFNVKFGIHCMLNVAIEVAKQTRDKKCSQKRGRQNGKNVDSKDL